MATKIQIKNFKKDLKIEKTRPGLFFVFGGSYFKTESQFAKSKGEKTCPCCGTKNDVFIWSFSGGGKKCLGCGVQLGHQGAFIELKKMTKQDLIDFIEYGEGLKDKTKFIKIETKDPEGFAQMSGIKKEIQDVVDSYSAEFSIEYKFE